MATSEIEIVSDSNDQRTSEQIPNQVVIVDIFSASAYGDFNKVKKFVEEDGVSLSNPDGNGYYALQWVALNNFPDIAQYIIEVYFITRSRNSCFQLEFVFLLAQNLIKALTFSCYLMAN